MLGGNQDPTDIFWGMGIDLLHPAFDVGERTGVSDRVSHDDPSRPFVVSLRDILKPLLARSVPNLHLDLLVVDDQ